MLISKILSSLCLSNFSDMNLSLKLNKIILDKENILLKFIDKIVNKCYIDSGNYITRRGRIQMWICLRKSSVTLELNQWVFTCVKQRCFESAYPTRCIGGASCGQEDSAFIV